MVTIELKHPFLRVQLHGWDRVRALRGSVTVPFGRIQGVRPHPPEAEFDDVIVDTWRGMGTYARGSMAVGTVMLRDGKSFFDVHQKNNVIAIDLTDAPLKHIVVELASESADAAAERIERALHMRSA